MNISCTREEGNEGRAAEKPRAVILSLMFADAYGRIFFTYSRVGACSICSSPNSLPSRSAVEGETWTHSTKIQRGKDDTRQNATDSELRAAGAETEVLLAEAR